MQRVKETYEDMEYPCPASFTLNNIPDNVLLQYIFIPEEEQKLIPYKHALF